MLAAEICFRTWIAVNGYQWARYDLQPKNIRGHGHGHNEENLKVLTENHEPNNPDVLRSYRPIEPFRDHPTLFREFASIQPGDTTAALAFASRYGMLESDTRFYWLAQPLRAGAYISGRVSSVPCDPGRTWFDHPAMIRAIIWVWEALKAKRIRDLATVFKWENSGSGHCWVHTPTPIPEISPSFLVRVVYRNSGIIGDRWPVNENEKKSESHQMWEGTEPITEVAAAFLRQEISKGLDEGGPHRARLAQESQTGRYIFQVSPSNLLGALYFQLGRVISGEIDQRPCKLCGKWFELKPADKGRKDFCTDSCKVREYRVRKSKAALLRKEGMSPKAIAEATGTDLETIRRWLNKH